VSGRAASCPALLIGPNNDPAASRAATARTMRCCRDVAIRLATEALTAGD